MMLRVVSLLILGIFGLLSACSPAAQPRAAQPTPAPIPKDVTVSEDDDGRIINLNVGDTLIVELASNPSTGYSWAVQDIAPDILMQLGEAQTRSGGGLIGSGGEVVFRFEAMRRGQTDLSLVYQRPFESSATPAQTFGVTVFVD